MSNGSFLCLGREAGLVRYAWDGKKGCVQLLVGPARPRDVSIARIPGGPGSLIEREKTSLISLSFRRSTGVSQRELQAQSASGLLHPDLLAPRPATIYDASKRN